jgi:hypothetical protein
MVDEVHNDRLDDILKSVARWIATIKLREIGEKAEWGLCWTRMEECAEHDLASLLAVRMGGPVV